MLLLFYVFVLFETLILVSSQRTMKRYNVMEPTVPTRRTTHSPQIISKTCLLIPEKGPCRSNIRMYFFDPGTLTCRVFTWGGCQGNGNRFDTEEACTNTCLSKSGWRDGPHRPRFCELSFDYGWCFGAENRYYYDRLWKTCKKAIFSGCGGNKNNFYNMEQCDQVCRFGNTPLRSARFDDKIVKKVIIVNPDYKKYGITDPSTKSRGPSPTGDGVTVTGDGKPFTGGNTDSNVVTKNQPAPTENTAANNANPEEQTKKPAGRSGKHRKHKKHHSHHNDYK